MDDHNTAPSEIHSEFAIFRVFLTERRLARSDARNRMRSPTCLPSTSTTRTSHPAGTSAAHPRPAGDGVARCRRLAGRSSSEPSSPLTARGALARVGTIARQGTRYARSRSEGWTWTAGLRRSPGSCGIGSATARPRAPARRERHHRRPRAERLEAAEAELEGGDRVATVAADVATVDGCRATVAAAWDAFRRLDILFTSAGDYGASSSTRWTRRPGTGLSIDTHLKGTFFSICGPPPDAPRGGRSVGIDGVGRRRAGAPRRLGRLLGREGRGRGPDLGSSRSTSRPRCG